MISFPSSVDRSHLPAALQKALTLSGTSYIQNRLGGLTPTFCVGLRSRPDLGYIHVFSLGLRDMQAAHAKLEAAAAKRAARN